MTDLKIIAEVSGNHLGNLVRARELVLAASECGATHVKFQTFTPEQMVGDPDYVIEDGPWAGRKLLDLYQETHLPRAWHSNLFDYARHLGIEPISTPFHPDDVTFLETLDCSMYKIASLENNYPELLEAVGRTKKPVMISRGASTKDNHSMASSLVWSVSGGVWPIMMACVSAYPSDPVDANLQHWSSTAIRDNLAWGLSDHTVGCGVAAAAVALGATVVEKHLTICRRDGGPDAGFSMEPQEFAQMAEACRQAHAAVSHPRKGIAESEKPSAKLRRSLWWAKDLPEGHQITREDIKIARPADGLSPEELPWLLNQITTKPQFKHMPVGIV